MATRSPKQRPDDGHGGVSTEVMKSRVGVRKLRSDLAGYIARAASGETIVVTVDGEDRARLAPLNGNERSSLEALARAGSIERPRAAGVIGLATANDESAGPEAPSSARSAVLRLLGRVRG